jgi:hypothetical protein
MRELKKLDCSDDRYAKLTQDRIQWQILIFLYYSRSTKSSHFTTRILVTQVRRFINTQKRI